MKQLHSLLIAGLLCAAAGETHAGIKNAHELNWNGTWQDTDGGIISIRKTEDFLDITGKDKASIYHCTCLLAKNGAAKCFGEGTNHKGNFRYLYQNTLFIKKNGNIGESWEAFSTKGNLSGQATFTKVESDNPEQRQKAELVR